MRQRTARRIVPLLVALAVLYGRMANASTAALYVNVGERLVVVAPHPDDETLGASGLIQRVISRGGTVLVVLVTAGDGYVEALVHETGQMRPRPADYIAYGDRRLREAHRAVRELGGDAITVHLLGFPDGSLEPLLLAHWGRTHPERSATTGAGSPHMLRRSTWTPATTAMTFESRS